MLHSEDYTKQARPALIISLIFVVDLQSTSEGLDLIVFVFLWG